MPLGPTVDPREQRKKYRSHAGHDERTDNLQAAGEILQQLEEAEEIPLGPRDVRGVGGIRRRLERRRSAECHHGQRGEHHTHRRDIARCVKRVERRRGTFAWPKRARDALAAHHCHVRGDQGNEHRREEDDVHGVPARQCQRADRGASLQDGGDGITRDRHQPRDVDRHDRRPIRTLIPWQEITSQRKTEHEPKEGEAGKPGELARRLVSAVADNAEQMKNQKHDDEARTKVVQAAHDTPRRRRVDETNAVVGVVRRGCVVKGEEGTRQDLYCQQAQQDTAEREQPPRASGQRFIQQDFTDASNADPLIEPLADPFDHNCTRIDLFVPSTRACNRSSGRGGGPAITRPSAS